MEKENVGIFSVEHCEETDKYIIVYIEKGERVVVEGEEYTFDSYEFAEEYIKSHGEELNNVVTEYKKSLEQEENSEENEEENSEENEEENSEEKEEEKDKDKKKKSSNGFIRFWAGFMAAVIALVGGHFLAKAISSAINNSDDTCYEETIGEETTLEPETSTSVSEATDELTEERFDELTADFAKVYIDNNVNVTVEDLIKTVSLINIDKLVEDNPELASQLFANQPKEEWLNDAAKVLAMTYTYNYNVYKETGSTQNFIRLSQGVSGSQKSALQTVEAYVDLIAIYSNDAEVANIVISQLIAELGDPASELSYLDDGVGVAMTTYLEFIKEVLVKDIINDKNRDALGLLTSMDEYISNIFTVYDKCNSSYTRTR